MYHCEEGLFERVFNLGRSGENPIEALLDRLRQFQRVENRTADADGGVSKAAGRVRIRQQIVRQGRVEIENRIAVEADIVRRVDEEFDGGGLRIIRASRASLPSASWPASIRRTVSRSE